MCTASACSCSPTLPGCRCCLERTLLTLIERYHVCVVFVCWLRLDFARVVCTSIGLGALGSLRLLSMLTIPSVCYPRPCRLELLSILPGYSVCYPRPCRLQRPATLQAALLQSPLTPVMPDCVCEGAGESNGLNTLKVTVAGDTTCLTAAPNACCTYGHTNAIHLQRIYLHDLLIACGLRHQAFTTIGALR
jgi:hypothetical protein